MSNITIGITGLNEIFSRDYGIEEHYCPPVQRVTNVLSNPLCDLNFRSKLIGTSAVSSGGELSSPDQVSPESVRCLSTHANRSMS